MKRIRFEGPDSVNFDVAPYRDGNAELRDGDEMEVPKELAERLLRDSVFFVEAKAKGKSNE
jgi:hypothetical protein